jgi:hypothetical protein
MISLWALNLILGLESYGILSCFIMEGLEFWLGLLLIIRLCLHSIKALDMLLILCFFSISFILSMSLTSLFMKTGI